MPSSLLTTELPQNKLRLHGIKATEDKIFDVILSNIEKKSCKPADFISILGLARETISRIYFRKLLAQGKIKKIEGTNLYQLAKQDKTPNEVKQDLLSESEIFKTNLFQNWLRKNKSKGTHKHTTRFARICLGLVNPKFKLHPDIITRDNWHDIVPNIVEAVLEVSKNKKRLTYDSRQAIRHAIMYGVDQKAVIKISEEDGIQLGIDGETPKPLVADLHITKEQVQEAKILLKLDKNEIWFLKFGFKAWTGVRPSTAYIVKTNDLVFYDRIVEYSEIDGKRFYKEDIVEHDKKLLLLLPQAKDIIKIDTFTHRACTLDVFENKTQSDFTKFIFDEEFVIALEKYVKQRKFQKKKYLFWEDNNTEFTFDNYDSIVKQQVFKDNNYFKKLFLQLGFTKEDFGVYFRANYGFRHFAIQMLLDMTDYDYDFVGSMFHEDVATLKKWYGKQSAEHLAKKAKEVVFA